MRCMMRPLVLVFLLLSLTAVSVQAGPGQRCTDFGAIAADFMRARQSGKDLSGYPAALRGMDLSEPNRTNLFAVLVEAAAEPLFEGPAAQESASLEFGQKWAQSCQQRLHESCLGAAETAKFYIELREQGAALTRIYEASVDAGVGSGNLKVLLDAYKQPIRPEGEARQALEQEFADKWFMQCMEDQS